jgi:hypothetical protein
MSVKTMGGEFTAKNYNIVKDGGGKEVGVNIELEFMPDAPVDAKKIGMTQMVNSINEGSVVALNDTVKSRSIPAGESGEGQHIDQLAQYKNPMYATGAAGSGDTKLGDTPTKSQWGQHGHHYKDDKSVLQKEKAILKDTPQLPNRGKNASQIFESTALGIEGAQAGTYYGSVRWGWETDGTGKFKQLPLSLVSSGVPTPTFMKAADLWNKGKTSGGEDTIDLPTSKHTSHNVCYTDEGLAKKIQELELKAKTDTDPNIQFEIMYLKQEQEQRQKSKGKN